MPLLLILAYKLRRISQDNNSYPYARFEHCGIYYPNNRVEICNFGE